MLGLTLQFDGSAIDTAIEELAEELSRLATDSGDRDLVRRRQKRKLYQNRQQKGNRYDGVASADGKRHEQTQAAANQIVAYLAAASRAAGFDLARNDDARPTTFRVDG